MKKAILCFSLLMFISCAGSVVYRPLTDEKYPYSKHVDVYTKEKPQKPYKEIGKIEVKGGDIIKAAIKKAKKVGADGIILASESKKIVYLSRRNPETQTSDISPETEVHALFIAIKYTEKD